ncbi:MAG: AAA family ATPase [Bacteroidaceae bacterium]|nr:AAA family ATPase [Bacteroidaceae bacterium]
MYINKGNIGFQRTRNSEYVDKSGLIDIVNQTLFTEQSFSCVTRCRRFGKSMAAKMLCAYYDYSCDSRYLFKDLEIAKHHSFEKHLNKYPVIYLDMTGFVTRFKDESIVNHIEKKLLDELKETYFQVITKEDDDLMSFLIRVVAQIGQHFIFIIDEWDAIYREFPSQSEAMDRYVDWLRRMFKDIAAYDVFAGVYLTGILPIKKYKTESALNNFIEYSMIDPGNMAPFFGFTKNEVQLLAKRYRVDFDELEKWYDGYQIGKLHSMFNPISVMLALRNEWCESYWGKTGATDAISSYIKLNYEGLKDDIIQMLSGARCKVSTTGFKNDLCEINSRDDVLTVLIHLGYLSYDRKNMECYIPNKEVAGEMEIAIRDNQWTIVVDALNKSEKLFQALLDRNEEAVAHGIEAAHDENTSILSYNNENSLACVLCLAFYYARNDYLMFRELPSGKGCADIVLIPRKHTATPPIILELKFSKDTETAINQRKSKNYAGHLKDITGEVILVCINYDKKTKKHECKIEKVII